MNVIAVNDKHNRKNIYSERHTVSGTVHMHTLNAATHWFDAIELLILLNLRQWQIKKECSLCRHRITCLRMWVCSVRFWHFSHFDVHAEQTHQLWKKDVKEFLLILLLPQSSSYFFFR